MSDAPTTADGEVRDTIVPQAATPEPTERDTVVPMEAAAPVFRRDPDRRVRRGLALGRGVALLVCATGLVPLTVVALLAPRGDAPAAPDGAPASPPVAPPTVDFAALRATIPIAPAPTTPTAPAGAPDASLHAYARLASRVYEAREAWRKSGQAGRELFRTASLDELGGAAFIDELQLGPRRFVWLRREARVLAPASAVVPEGVTLKDAGNDPGPTSADGALEGSAVRVIRTCMFGETYCLVDVVDRATAAAPPASAPDQGARLAAFDAAVVRETQKLAAWAPPTPSSTTRATGGLVVPLGAGLGVALVLVSLTSWRLRRIAAALVAATGRLRAASAGRVEPSRAEPGDAAELAELDVAIDEASGALGDGALRAGEAARRRARLGELAEALAAAAAGHLEARAPLSPDDDAALAALAAGTNAALEKLDARVRGLKSQAMSALDAASPEALRALHTELCAISTSGAATAAAGRRDPATGDAGRRPADPPP